MTIDLNQPAPKVADQMIDLFWINCDRPIKNNAKECAIKCVEAMLLVCPEITPMNGNFKNPDHTKLTEVLQILKTKI